MKQKFLVLLLSLSFLLPLPAFADDHGDLMQKIDQLSKELDRLKQQMSDIQSKEAVKDQRITTVEKKTEDVEKKTDEQAAASSWFTIGGDYRARMDSLHGTTSPGYVLFSPVPGPSFGEHVANDNVLTNRFGLNLTARATEDVLVHARLLMYKIWGEENDSAVAGPGSAFFADKFYLFDGNVSHIPQDNTLRVDQAFATWSNIGGVPLWFSIGRRPATGGVPTNLRMNTEKTGTAGTPGLLIDYAFDGGTIGYAPDIDALPGAYTKFCFGKGFDSGFRPTTTNTMQDVWFLGLNVVPVNTDNLHIEFQYDRALDIFGFPETDTFSSGPMTVNNANIGDIDQYGAVFMGTIPDLGIGDLNLFVSPAVSVTHPNGRYLDFGGGMHYGLFVGHCYGHADEIIRRRSSLSGREV